MYYVYEWFIVETGEVIYVGKGTGRRYKVRKHNRLFNEMIRRFECDSRIVKEFGTEREAFEFEFVRINEMHERGQCVCNIHNGGYGGTVEWWTDELRAHYSEINVMKSEEQRKRMSENNPMKDKKIAEKTVTEEDGWRTSFKNLPVCHDHGKKYAYTISADHIFGGAVIRFQGRGTWRIRKRSESWRGLRCWRSTAGGRSGMRRTLSALTGLRIPSG